jgi:16S rRNA (guanine966-N2)-methyltransferase
MRVTGGTKRGTLLAVPPGRIVRPTRDAVRQALFNILGEWVQGKRVLDLYAGSGSLGIEALSRGAAEAVFVENDPAVAPFLEANIRKAGLPDRATIERANALEYLDSVSRGVHPGGFQGVFADPPFAFSDSPALAGLVEKLKSDALWGSGDLVCIIEVESVGKRVDLLEALPGKVEFRGYGRNLLAIARRRAAAAG